MSEAKHTKLPWETGILPGLWKRPHDVGIAGNRTQCYSEDCTGTEFEDGICWTSVAIAIGVEGSEEITAANAAFIVTACNAHYDLLAACEALPLNCDFTDAADFVDRSADFRQAMELARAAIQKAKGEA